MVKDFRFLQVRVSPDLMESLKTAAWKKRTSVTQLVTTVLTAFITAINAQETDPQCESSSDSSDRPVLL